MSKNAANEELMGQLHAAVAEKLIEQLSQEETDPRVITAAISFLNNNKIVMNPYVTEALSDLQQALLNKQQRFKVVEDAKEATEKLISNG